MNLCKLLSAAGFCDEIDGQLVGPGAADEVGEVVELERRWGSCGLLGEWGRGDGLLFKRLGLAVEVRQERARLTSAKGVRSG